MATSSSEANFVINVDKNQEISRGDEPEYILDFTKIENLVVYDENGEGIRVGEIYKQQKTILILVRVGAAVCCYGCHAIYFQILAQVF
jgi:hypothetical protein